MVSTSNTSLNSLIASSLQQVYSTLNKFANGDDFIAKTQSIFGVNFDASKLGEIRQQWINSNFTSLPPIEIRSGSELQGANAAYAGSNNTIYSASQKSEVCPAQAGLAYGRFGLWPIPMSTSSF